MTFPRVTTDSQDELILAKTRSAVRGYRGRRHLRCGPHAPVPRRWCHAVQPRDCILLAASGVQRDS